MDLLVFAVGVVFAWGVWAITEKVISGLRRLFAAGAGPGETKTQGQVVQIGAYGRIVFENCRLMVEEAPGCSTDRQVANGSGLKRKGNVIFLPSRG